MTFCKWNLAAYKFLVVFCYCCCYDLLENSFACVIFLPLGFFFLLLFPLFWVVPLMRFHLWIVSGNCFEEWLFGFNIQQTPIIWHRLFLHKWSVFILWLQTHSLTPEVSLPKRIYNSLYGNGVLAMLSSWKVNIAENPIVVLGLHIRSGFGSLLYLAT